MISLKLAGAALVALVAVSSVAQCQDPSTPATSPTTSPVVGEYGAAWHSVHSDERWEGSVRSVGGKVRLNGDYGRSPATDTYRVVVIETGLAAVDVAVAEDICRKAVWWLHDVDDAGADIEVIGEARQVLITDDPRYDKGCAAPPVLA